MAVYRMTEKLRENSNYQDFLASKSLGDKPSGLDNLPNLPSMLKPFQTALTQWALRRGRAALFEGTGLGKTLQQLSWARAVADHEDGPILILTPLAVAEQTVTEANKFGISSVAYAADRKQIRTEIVVTNYERFEKFNINEFAGVVLDESGIIKSHDGKTRALLTDGCRNIPWRLCCTATPAPNDYAELGQHSEFLGVMTAKEMLSMFFVHDGSIRANDDSGNSDGWRLKRHAEKDFWRWLASWAAVVRHPRDLGFEDASYDLPPLNLHQVTVAADYKPIAGQLFPFMASTLSERIGVRRDTAMARVAAAAEIVGREPNEPWLIWCNLNNEADAIEDAMPKALQVAGRHAAEIKVERLLGFKSGRPPILISKPSLAGHGMNWQHCSRMVFVGLTDSFEQIYQAVRRCWRFGQRRSVECYFVVSELEGNVVANIHRKEDAFNKMQDAMSIHMRDLMQEQVLGRRKREPYNPKIKMEIPQWLA
jgi:hypothetical protein